MQNFESGRSKPRYGQMITTTSNRASIQIWAKGFAVSDRTQEFQLVVPSSESMLRHEESATLAARWIEHLQPLYRTATKRLEQEFAVFFPSPNRVLGMCATHSFDHVKRKSIVVAAVLTEVDWTSPLSCATRIAWTCETALKAASSFARDSSKMPDLSERLRANEYLQDRRVDFADDDVRNKGNWIPLVDGISRWSGVRGLASTGLATIGRELGANVLVGSAFDLDLLSASGVTFDGWLDPNTLEFSTLTGELQRWGSRAGTVRSETTDLTRGIRSALEDLATEQRRQLRLMEKLMDMVRELERRR
jgi:hypothetical protein